ncbi:hypothetical protein D3C86_1689750 [compost metagenome]
MGHDKGAILQCAHQHRHFQDPRVFARGGIEAIDIDQAGLGLVAVVSCSFVLVGVLEKGQGHFSQVLVPVRHLVDVPELV